MSLHLMRTEILGKNGTQISVTFPTINFISYFSTFIGI